MSAGDPFDPGPALAGVTPPSGAMAVGGTGKGIDTPEPVENIKKFTVGSKTYERGVSDLGSPEWRLV